MNRAQALVIPVQAGMTSYAKVSESGNPPPLQHLERGPGGEVGPALAPPHAPPFPRREGAEGEVESATC